MAASKSGKPGPTGKSVNAGASGGGKFSLKEGKHAEAISHNIQQLHSAGADHQHATHMALKLAGVSQHLVTPIAHTPPPKKSPESGGAPRSPGGAGGVGAPSGGVTRGGMHNPHPPGHSTHANPDAGKPTHFGVKTKGEHMKDGNKNSRGYGSAASGRKAESYAASGKSGATSQHSPGKQEKKGASPLSRKSGKK